MVSLAAKRRPYRRQEPGSPGRHATPTTDAEALSGPFKESLCMTDAGRGSRPEWVGGW